MTGNTLAQRQPRLGGQPMFLPELMRRMQAEPFFGFPGIATAAGNRWGIMDEPESMEDGSTVLRYNLAGYTKEDINVHLDTTNSQIVIAAESTKDSGAARKYQASISVPPYTSAEDLKTSYVDGVLTITVAPLESRKAEAMIPLTID